MPPYSFGKTDATFGANLALLAHAVADGQRAGRTVADAVGQYQRRLGDLDQRLEELHDLLDDPKRAHDRTEDTLLALERMLGKFDIPRQVEETLKRGKHADFDQFLQSYDRVAEARRAVGAFNAKSASLKPAKEAGVRLDKLAHEAEETLLSMFRDTLSLGSRPVDPRDIAPELLADPTYSLPLLHRDSLGTLLAIAKRLQLTVMDYMQPVVEVQGRVIFDSLQQCYQRDSRVAPHRASDVANYRKGTHSYIFSLRLLLRLASTEHRICKVLLNADPDLDLAAADHLPDTARAADATLAAVKQSAERCVQEGTALCAVGTSPDGIFLQLDILEHLATHRSTIQSLGLDSLFRPLVQALRRSVLRFLLEYIQTVSENDAKGSSDGVVHQLTTGTLHFLNRLHDYPVVAEDVLGEEPSLRSGPGANPLLRYGRQVLGALQDSLTRKASQFRHQRELAAVFLLNNCHYTLRTLQQSPALRRQGSEEMARLEALVKDLQGQYFTASWGKAVAILTDKYVSEIDRKLAKHQGAARMSTATKDLIKQMFSEFFEEFDSRYHQQLHFNIPDDQLRSTLQRLIRTEVLPRYAAAVERYGGLQFTSSLGKYLKYDAKTLEAMIDALFQGKLRPP